MPRFKIFTVPHLVFSPKPKKTVFQATIEQINVYVYNHAKIRCIFVFQPQECFSIPCVPKHITIMNSMDLNNKVFIYLPSFIFGVVLISLVLRPTN